MGNIQQYNKTIVAIVTPILGWILTAYIPQMPEDARIALISGLTAALVYFVANKKPPTATSTATHTAPKVSKTTTTVSKTTTPRSTAGSRH